MVSLQIISKVLATKDLSIIKDNMLTEEFFVGYEDEYNFIMQHEQEYGTVPDEATFLSKFDVDLVEVTESDRYLLETIREEYLYHKAVPVVQKIADLLKEDANVAAEYMLQSVKDLQPNYGIQGVDIIREADIRRDEYLKRKEKPNDYFFTTGFPELDEVVHGWQRGEELVVILARTNQAKSWVLEKSSTHIWQLGYNVGYVSLEMSPNSIGYRFDTLYRNFSNTDLVWGKDGIDEQEYESYVNELKEKDNKFVVVGADDFNRRITVTKLKNFINQHNLDVLAIDGITYLSDERMERNDTKSTQLTHISEDLMNLSIELNIPILVVVQANRGGVVTDEEGTPDIEHIRDSDGIAHNASKILAMRLKDRVLTMEVKKQRNGMVGKKLRYQLDINVGEFNYMTTLEDVTTTARRQHTETSKPKEQSVEDVF